jgi:hypothetical protein
MRQPSRARSRCRTAASRPRGASARAGAHGRRRLRARPAHARRAQDGGHLRAACTLLQAWLAAAGLTTTKAAKPYVFVLGGGRAGGAVDHAKPLDARRWTEVV